MEIDQLKYFFQTDREPTNTISDHIDYQLTGYNAETQEFSLRSHVTKWMCNLNGTIHGGMIATIIDQAMGLGAYCAKPGKYTCATIEMNVNYHRPLLPDEDILIFVKLRSVGRQTIHTACEVYRDCEPGKICVSSTAVYFARSKEE